MVTNSRSAAFGRLPKNNNYQIKKYNKIEKIVDKTIKKAIINEIESINKVILTAMLINDYDNTKVIKKIITSYCQATCIHLVYFVSTG